MKVGVVGRPARGCCRCRGLARIRRLTKCGIAVLFLCGVGRGAHQVRRRLAAELAPYTKSVAPEFAEVVDQVIADGIAKIRADLDEIFT